MNITLDKSQQEHFDNLILTIELVPKTVWFSNVRDILTRPQWDKLRKTIFEQADNKCEICGEIGPKHPVECHEVWSYNDQDRIQSLTKLISLCPDCHKVKHNGMANKLGKEIGKNAFLKFQKTNSLSDENAKLYYDYYFAIWKERSKVEWQLDISYLANYNIDLDGVKVKLSELERKQ